LTLKLVTNLTSYVASNKFISTDLVNA
jgi:hypothetical protein